MKLFFRCIILAWLALLPGAASAKGLALIRDAEIEYTLRTFGTPIFEAADLTPSAIHIFIVNQPDINAYVAGGSNMFIHTGLILATDTPGMLIGVMAHESGHMAGGHLAQGTEKLKNAQLGTVLSSILGAAIMAGGGGDLGAAVMTGGTEFAKRNFLAFSRQNEQSADQAGLNYLDDTNISADGFLHILERLRQNENRAFGKVDPYALTHPLSTDRITHIRNHLMQSNIPKDKYPAGYQAMYDRMIAKLRGFLDAPSSTLRRYPLSDKSIPARYARAVSYYRTPDLPHALAEIDSLIAELPRDAFFHELKGQILYENGRADEAIKEYESAAKLHPDSPLILTDYAKARMSRANQDDLIQATKDLEKSAALDASNIGTWELLAVAYGKQGDKGRSLLAQAEKAALENHPEQMKQFVTEAMKLLPKAGPSRLRAEDLMRVAEKMKEDKDKD